MTQPKRIKVPGNFDPHVTQLEFLASDASTKVLMAGRRWGKTRASAAQVMMWIQEASMTRCFDEEGKDVTHTLRPPVHVWVVGPNYSQLKTVMEEFAYFIPEHQILRAGYQTVAKGTRQWETRLRLKTERGMRPHGCVRPEVLIEFKSAENYEALQTVGLDVLYLTESQDIKDEALDKVLPTTISPYRSKKVIFEGIPPDSEQHWFARHWNLANRGSTPGTEAFKYKSTDNPHIGPDGLELIASYRDRMTDEAWRRMFFAKQPKGAGAFFRNIFEAARLNAIDYESGPVIGERYVAGLDIGRRNSESVLVVKNSRTRDSVYAEAFGDADWEYQLTKFEEICNNWRVDILHFDGTSCGGDIMDYLLSKTSVPAVPYNFSSQSKSELYNKYAIALEQGLVAFPKEWTMLIKQLQAVRNVSTKQAKFESDSGLLDDWVDAECLALWVCENDVLDEARSIYEGTTPQAHRGVLPTSFANKDRKAYQKLHGGKLAERILRRVKDPSPKLWKYWREHEEAWN